jgi:microcystin-dependent protein
MDPFIGEVRLLPYNFAPRNWALCNGQLLPISQNTALYSLIGTMYGGNGTTTFGLPNLQGCVVPGAGHGPGLQDWTPGMQEGADSVTLEATDMPAHNHSLSGLDVSGSADAPATDAWLGRDQRGGQGVINFLAPSDTTVDTSLDTQALTVSGGSQPHENRQPFLGVSYCIALYGIFPSRP